MDALTFREVTRETWRDFEALFESRGGPSYCWCMVFRAAGPELKDTSRAGRKAALKRRVETGVPVGLLAYRDGEPIGWCSVGPKRSFLRLGGEDPPDESVWSITCFFLRRGERGAGLTRKLLDAAVAHARARGAKVIEGYPVLPDSPSYRFMGFVPMFDRAGFSAHGTVGTRRHLVQKKVRATPGARSPADGPPAPRRRTGTRAASGRGRRPASPRR